jgi:hypothetical protein
MEINGAQRFGGVMALADWRQMPAGFLRLFGQGLG